MVPVLGRFSVSQPFAKIDAASNVVAARSRHPFNLERLCTLGPIGILSHVHDVIVMHDDPSSSRRMRPPSRRPTPNDPPAGIPSRRTSPCDSDMCLTPSPRRPPPMGDPLPQTSRTPTARRPPKSTCLQRPTSVSPWPPSSRSSAASSSVNSSATPSPAWQRPRSRSHVDVGHVSEALRAVALTPRAKTPPPSHRDDAMTPRELATRGRLLATRTGMGRRSSVVHQPWLATSMVEQTPGQAEAMAAPTTYEHFQQLMGYRVIVQSL